MCVCLHSIPAPCSKFHFRWSLGEHRASNLCHHQHHTLVLTLQRTVDHPSPWVSTLACWEQRSHLELCPQAPYLQANTTSSTTMHVVTRRSPSHSTPPALPLPLWWTLSGSQVAQHLLGLCHSCYYETRSTVTALWNTLTDTTHWSTVISNLGAPSWPLPQWSGFLSLRNQKTKFGPSTNLPELKHAVQDLGAVHWPPKIFQK